MKAFITVLGIFMSSNALAASGLYTCAGFADAPEAKVSISVKDMVASVASSGVITPLGMDTTAFLENGQWQYSFKSLATDRDYELVLIFNEDTLGASLYLKNTVDGAQIDLGTALCQAL